tara:strand:- start:40 stop:2724 length:2685 start_codon:yes stop_codon:yes gene_type:complete
MIKGSLRTLLLSSAVSVGMIAASGTAQAVEYNFGGLKLNLDTTVSAGVSMRTAQRKSVYLNTANGGPKSGFAAVVPGGLGATLTGANALTGGADPGINISAAPIPAGSINSDDSRLNFDQGDLTSAVVKMTNDLSGSFQNYNFFARLSSYYDAVLNDGGSYARSELVDGKASAARDVKLLDLYVSADYNVGDLPLNIRAGKQVISWGESTFFLNGINSANPIDVGAFRRPGSEVKEGLVPVWAVDASIGLPYNLSLEAFYQLKWEPYELDRAGTPFASSDVVAGASGIGGSQYATSFITTDVTGGNQRNCETTSSNNLSAAFTNAYGISGNTKKDCTATTGYNQYVDYANTIPFGMIEEVKFGLADTGGMVVRERDREARDMGQWGVAARWFSEDLNNTEFGLYFMNYHSRLPIVGERVYGNQSDDTQFTSYLATGDDGSGSGRGTYFTGCNLPTTGAAATALTVAPGAAFGVPILQTQGGLNQLNTASTNGTPDPDGVYAIAKTIAQAWYDGDVGTLAGFGLTNAVNTANAGNPFQTGAGGINGVTAAATIIGANAANGVTGLNGQGAGVATVSAFSALEATIINCALVALQSSSTGAPTGALLQDGSEIMSVQSAAGKPFLGLFLEYPEDIHMVGASFNSTIGTWGIQGEMSYRSNQPFQLDTDQITIAALNNACILSIVASPTIANAANDTYGGGCGQLQANGGNVMELSGVTRSKMWTFDVGTTATYAKSNPFIAMTGADLGVLLTEVGLIYTPDAPDEGDFTRQQWGNVCTGGTDLPFGGALGLANRTGCRPTKTSWGYTLLGQLQYNNAFGTALTLSPTVAFSHDVHGNTPGPISNYREGRKSLSLQLNGSFQSAWRGGISYTNYFGDEKYNEATDRDFASVNISYAF